MRRPLLPAGLPPSATPATPPPAPAASRTRSRSASTARTARLRWATTATSSTPQMLRDELEARGRRLRHGTDSEVIAQHARRPRPASTGGSAWRTSCASSTAPTALDDSHPGRRHRWRATRWATGPLCLGKLDGGWVLASETLRLRPPRRDVHPRDRAGRGDRASTPSGLHELQAARGASRQAFCVFEYIYFARPDSVLDGKLVYPLRMNARRASWRRSTRPTPTSSSACRTRRRRRRSATRSESGMPFVEGLVKNRYVGRTFISPTSACADRAST